MLHTRFQEPHRVWPQQTSPCFLANTMCTVHRWCEYSAVPRPADSGPSTPRRARETVELGLPTRPASSPWWASYTVQLLHHRHHRGHCSWDETDDAVSAQRWEFAMTRSSGTRKGKDLSLRDAAWLWTPGLWVLLERKAWYSQETGFYITTTGSSLLPAHGRVIPVPPCSLGLVWASTEGRPGASKTGLSFPCLKKKNWTFIFLSVFHHL